MNDTTTTTDAAQAEQSEVVTCRCLTCSRPLTESTSVAYRRGPVCRARAEVAHV